MFSSCRATCPSSPGELGQGTWTTAGCRVTSSLSITPRFQAGNPVCLAPAETRTWTRTWTRNLDKFYHVFSSYRATCPSSPGELAWTTAGCRVTSSLSITPRFQAGPDSNFVAPNLDKELGQVLSRVFLLQSHLSKFARGTWTRNLDNCGLPCYKLSQYYAPIPGRPRFRVPRLSLFLEGVSQMDSILPERLPALVRPAFDLVLRRIRSLKRCVQACGCKIMTPRYAPQFGSRLHFKRCQPLPKETPFPSFFGDPFFWDPFFGFFLALQRLARLKCNLEPNCKHI